MVKIYKSFMELWIHPHKYTYSREQRPILYYHTSQTCYNLSQGSHGMLCFSLQWRDPLFEGSNWNFWTVQITSPESPTAFQAQPWPIHTFVFSYNMNTFVSLFVRSDCMSGYAWFQVDSSLWHLKDKMHTFAHFIIPIVQLVLYVFGLQDLISHAQIQLLWTALCNSLLP